MKKDRWGLRYTQHSTLRVRYFSPVYRLTLRMPFIAASEMLSGHIQVVPAQHERRLLEVSH